MSRNSGTCAMRTATPMAASGSIAVGGREVVEHERGDDEEGGLQQLADADAEDGLQHGGREREPSRREAHVLAVALQPDDEVDDDAEVRESHRQSRAGDAPVEHEDEQQVEDEVRDRSTR